MKPDDMRAVVFTANTEDDLLKGLGDIPGYELSRVQDSNRHPLILTSPSGAKIHVRHTPDSTCATTSNILPQDHEAKARPIEDDEATKLSRAAKEVTSLEATLRYSTNDHAKLTK